MVRLKEKKLKDALTLPGKHNKERAALCEVGVRRFLQLKAQYKKTGELPILNSKRRPKTELSDEDKALIDKAIQKSLLRNAVALNLYITKHYEKNLPIGKIHKHLLYTRISKPDLKKQKQRKYCRYQRDHSGSLGHMDFHDSKAIPDKKVIVWEDDASRYILAGGEYDQATTKVAKTVVLAAKKKAWETYNLFLRELNTDQGCQFYSNHNNAENERALSQFELFLRDEGIKHIPSRRNHPQTNGKEERWFRTYEENRAKFNTFTEFLEWYNNRIHLGLSRTEGITPSEAILNKSPTTSLLGLFFKNLSEK